MKNVFLSASIPLPERHPKYYETADVIAIRDAVIAISTLMIPNFRIIWGGHPSITPLINYVIEQKLKSNLDRIDKWERLTEEEKFQLEIKLKKNIQEHLVLYQSLFFKDKFIDDINKFENVKFTENTGDIHSSIQHMRMRMFNEYDYSAAIFIGGMDGIEVEFNMFRELHPDALVLPVASTGAASKIVYDTILPTKFKNERLITDYGYMSMFQKLLIDKI